jgi:putative membrane protein
MNALFAFLHHVAAFALVAGLAIEFVLIRDELTVRRARSLQLADAAIGASATVVLVVGFLRVFYFEKGAAYYFHSLPFIAKLSLFVIIALASIYPTIEFLSWSKALKRGEVPSVSPRKLRAIRAIIHGELACIVLLILCAALMAKGIGYAG